MENIFNNDIIYEEIKKKQEMDDKFIENFLNASFFISKSIDTNFFKIFNIYIKERFTYKQKRLEYSIKFMKEMGFDSINDIKYGLKSKYKEKIDSQWIIENFEYIRDKLFELRSEEYITDSLKLPGGYKIGIYFLYKMIRNLCGNEMINVKRTRLTSDSDSIKIMDFEYNNIFGEKCVEYYDSINIEKINKYDFNKIKERKIEKKIEKIKNEKEGYIYIIYLREFKNMGLNIYKIGRTQDLVKRKRNYPKGSEYKLSIYVKETIKLEAELKKKFDEKFIKKHEFGSEYFEGDLDSMILIIKSYIH